MEGMAGGDLQLFNGDKEVGMQQLRDGGINKDSVETVSYESPGKMILTHGSEVNIEITYKCYVLNYNFQGSSLCNTGYI